MKYVYGIQDLAAYIGCCASTIYDLKKRGVPDVAIVSKVSKRIVFKPRWQGSLPIDYQRQRRTEL